VIFLEGIESDFKIINRPKFIFRFCESNIFPSSVSYYLVFHNGKIYQLKINGHLSRTYGFRFSAGGGFGVGQGSGLLTPETFIFEKED